MGLCVFFPSFVFPLENIPSNTKTHGNHFSKGVICVYICVCMWVGAQRRQKRALDALDLELRDSCMPLWVLGTNPGSSERAAVSLN